MEYYHLSALPSLRAKKYGDRVALKYRCYKTDTWIPISWNELSNNIDICANAMAELGIAEQENVGIFSQNKPEWFYVDFGAFKNRAVTIPFYATSSAEQAQYIINDAQIKTIFVGEQYQYDTVRKVKELCASLQHIIIFDETVVKEEGDNQSIYFCDFIAKGKDLKHKEIIAERMSRANTEDIANILYTSGTTGEPKGVVLTHNNYVEQFRGHDIRLDTMSDKDVSVCFLPLTHVLEKAWCYLCLHKGVQICVNLRPTEIRKTLVEIRPTLMCSVPRFWEKVYDGVIEKINNSKGIMKMVMLDAMKVGQKHNIDYVRLGKKAPFVTRLKYKFYEKTIYKLLKKVIGVENGNFFPTAGAAVPEEVQRFIKSVGINMMVGYGLTETTATVSVTPDVGYQIGSIGYPLPGVEVKISDEGEILVKGKGVTRGYYNKPEETKKAFTEDGWFRTGDAGHIKDGQLYITDRIKDLLKTSNGKYIAPQALETQLVVDKYIDQITIIANNRRFVSALIVPEYNQLKKYAEENNIKYNSIEELIALPEVKGLYQRRIDVRQESFAHFEKIKRFTLLAEPFSMERGEVTNTLKVKRNKVAENYKDVIEKMYEQ